LAAGRIITNFFLETFGGKLLLDSDLSTMAKQQNVIDATIDLIKGGKDASEVQSVAKVLSRMIFSC
jgi:hypothetical protein